jgi:predicted nucleotidyltransferase
MSIRPGLLKGLYVVGSGVLGDYRPRSSDVDVVAVTAEQLEGEAKPAAAGPRRAANDVTMESVR